MTGITTKLAQFATRAGPLPAHAMDVLRLSLLDWAAVGLAGRDEPVSQILRAQALEEGGAEQANMFGLKQQVPARMAALVNGATSHALDYDDTHFAHIGHPSVAVIPAALAVAQLRDSGGRSFQEAALVGVEASIRIGMWLGRSHYQAGYHQTATAGAFGACLAATRLLDFRAEQVEMALGLVSTRSSGLKSQFGSMGKPLNAGIAAANGVEAALLVAKGFVSVPSALEDPQGFGSTHSGEALAEAFSGLGEEWLFPTVQHKFHACCHGLHSALEAIEQIKKYVDLNQLERIVIHTHPRWMTVCNIKHPKTGLEAKFSYRAAIGLSLLGFDTGVIETFSDRLAADVELLKMMQKIDVVSDKSIPDTATRVRCDHKTGSDIVEFDLNTPLSLKDRQSRVHAKAKSLIGADQFSALLLDIDKEASANEFAVSLAK